jgi:hypothetical protein
MTSYFYSFFPSIFNVQLGSADKLGSSCCSTIAFAQKVEPVTEAGLL